MVDFPVVSDLNQPTNLLEPWWGNATERVLGATGNSARDQWLRKITLTTYSEQTGEGTDLSQLRINFTVKKPTSGGTPNLLYARVYNLSKETMQKVTLFNRVLLAAGYQKGNFGTIFDGKVVMYVRGKENAVDTYLDIFAGDGSEWLNATVNLTWPADTLWSQQVKDSLTQSNIPIERVDLGSRDAKTLKSTSYIGMTYNIVRDKTNAGAADFFLDDGKAIVIPREGYRTGEAVVLSPQTGMVGIPQITPNGIEIKCLLNSKLRIGGLFKVESDWLSNVPYYPGSTQEANFRTGIARDNYTETGNQNFPRFPAISPQGLYKILLLEHSGDTRGNPWYSSIVGIAQVDGIISSIGTDALSRGVLATSAGAARA